MGDVSVKLRECIIAMNSTFLSKQANIKKDKEALNVLNNELHAINKRITAKNEKIENAETEVDALENILTHTQSRYDVILKSSQELMNIVESYAHDN